MYLHEVHHRDGRSWTVKHANANPSHHDLVEIILAAGNVAVAVSDFIRMLNKGRA